MKSKTLFTLTVLSVLIGGLGDAHATTQSASVFTQPNIQAAALKTGDVIILPDGRRATYVHPSDAPTTTGWYINGNGTYSAGTYGDRTAANETRHIAAATAEAEGRILHDRISERINAAMHQQSPNAQGVFALGNGGMNAGNHGSNVGVWAQYGYSHIKDSGGVSDFRANLHTGTVGVDYLFTPCFLAGLAFTYGHINDGKYKIRDGKYEHDSYTAALYAALIAHQFVSFDAMLAYGKVHKKLKEKKVTAIVGDPLILDTAGPDLMGRTHSRRFIGSIFANARYMVEQIGLWLRFGYLHTHDNEDSFNMSDATNAHATETRPGGTVNLGNLSGRLRACYHGLDIVTPYVQGGVNYNVVHTKFNTDFGPSANDKRFGWMVGGGLRLTGFGDSTSGGVQYTFNKRGDLKVHSVTLDVRHDF